MPTIIAGIFAFAICMICTQAAFAGAGKSKSVTNPNQVTCPNGKIVSNVSKCNQQHKKKH
jgi:hypothetical protein